MANYSASPPVRVIERRCTEVHSQTRCFSISVQSLIPCLCRKNSTLNGAAGDFIEANAEDDDVRAERPRLGGTARGACEALAQEGERGLDRVAAELLVGAVGDHAPPASPPVGVVLVHLDADTRDFGKHGGLA